MSFDRSSEGVRPGAREWSRITILLAVALLCAGAAPAAAAEGEGHNLIFGIALSVLAASIMGMAMQFLRQPLILGYILAGVIIGPVALALITDQAQILTIAEIGLILLLFMIGLEIDLRKMLAAGKFVIVTGLLQFPVCVGLSYLALWGLEAVGLPLIADPFARLYVAIAVSMSSTMIVVKLLYEKFELDTLASRITIGVLVFQDLWAIVVLVLQPNLANPDILGIARTVLSGLLLVAAALATSRWLLPFLFRTAAKAPELMLVISLGWCFLVCLVAAHPLVGLSMEMGALIAGVKLATFPYNLEVIAKVVSIRDFFITLFFVALGMQIPMPTMEVLVVAGGILLIALIVRFLGVFAVLESLGAGHRISLVNTINLAQVSEFSLVILALGVAFGHIEQSVLTYIIWVFALLAVASTYLIKGSHTIQRLMGILLIAIGWKDFGQRDEEERIARDYDIVILGLYRVGSAFIDQIVRKHAHLIPKIMVIDFNPLVKEKLDDLGITCVYGDIASLETLHHAGISQARVVLCTIPDQILKGTTNEKLLHLAKSLCPEARVFVTAESPVKARHLYEEGADYVIMPSSAAGGMLIGIVELALGDHLDEIAAAAIGELGERREILA